MIFINKKMVGFLLIQLAALFAALITTLAGPTSYKFLAYLLRYCVYTNGIVLILLLEYRAFNPFLQKKISPLFKMLITFTGTLLAVVLGTLAGLQVLLYLFWEEYYWYEKIKIVQNNAVLTLLGGGLYALYRLYITESARYEEKKHRLQIETRLKILQSRIHPHFLYNTLNVIIAKALDNKQEGIAEIVTRLAHMYRRVLQLSDDTFIPLNDELAIVSDYLEIEKLRFGKRLDYTIAISDENIKKFLIMPLLIEVLAENAVIHGIAPNPEGGTIIIDITCNGMTLEIIVSDNGIGIDTEHPKEGYGLHNVQERLKYAYGGKAKLRYSPLSPHGTKVIMEVPYDTQSSNR